jgi:RNA polymerase sigma-70 factor, ECF subfamily
MRYSRVDLGQVGDQRRAHLAPAVDGPALLDDAVSVDDSLLVDSPASVDAEVLPTLETFEAFYRRELPGLVMLARALAGSANADDVAQDAMLTAYNRWDRVSRYESPGAWVRQVCANRAVSMLRRRSAEARALVRLRGRRDVPPPLSENSETFWAEVRRLPRRQAQSVALFYIYDFGVADVAATLGCSEGSVKVHLSRGRAALARRLGDVVEELS